MLGRDHARAQLPHQQAERIVGMICFQSVHLGGLIKEVQSEVVSWTQLGIAVKSGECRLQCAERAIGWELCT